MIVTLTAGAVVYVVMQQQTHTILSNSLQASLQSRTRLFESEIEHALDSAQIVATRPLLIAQLRLMDTEPRRAAATAILQGAASSFLPTGFTALSFYDANDREVASVGAFSAHSELQVPLQSKSNAHLMWNKGFMVDVSVDMLDQNGNRIGRVRTQADLPQLTRSFSDVVSIGKTGEFAVCAPVQNEVQKMDCFTRQIAGQKMERFPRTIGDKPLPMNYALIGQTGIVVAKDYRQELVIAAHSPVGSLGLGMVLKIDQAELYQPVTGQLKFIAPLLITLLMIGMFLLNVLVAPLVRKLVNSDLATRIANTRLRNSEAQLREISDAVPAWITYLDAEQRFRFHNEAYETANGLTHAQINGKTLREVIGDDLYEVIRPKVEEVLSGYPVVYERPHQTKSGGARDYVINYFPRYSKEDNQGTVVGFYMLATDITELKRIDRMKSEFVSTVSHELRTPLTSIRGSLGLISGGVAGKLPDAVMNLVGIAKNNCERLIRLINDILDIEKIESGKMQLNLQVIDLKPLLVQALAANEGFGAAKNVKLRLVCPDATIRVNADSDRLTQVITNLLSNAVKFSPADNAVEVLVLRTGLGVRVEVQDRGPGIPEEFRPRIFQKFSQADSSDSREKSGTGLGLNISRAIIEHLGGSIGFQTDAAQGTTFFFELPVWAEFIPVRSSLAEGPPEPTARVLVCEDDRDIAGLICVMLDKGGFAYDMAHSAAQAHTLLEHTRYDAMTVDLSLPDEDGITLIHALRKQAETRNFPIVVVSASATEGKIRFNDKLLTVSDWLHKPIDENQLVLALRQSIAGLAQNKPRILHVEDDFDIQRITAAIAQDFAIFEFAATLHEARVRLLGQNFDLILLDQTLMDGSGWDLLPDIEALPKPPPVVVFSATDVPRTVTARVAAVLVKAQTSNAQLQQTLQLVLQKHPSDHP